MKLKKYISYTLLLIAFGGVIAQTDHSSMKHAEQGTHQTKEADFAERELAVMPFDLSATLHLFTDTATGGIQRVVVNDPGDADNIALIRSHLAKEAEAFAEGEFVDPSYLHGETMPGLVDLKAAGKAGRLEVTYRDLDDGGQITYLSTDASVVIALHLWFQAQVADHGAHATN